MIQSDIERVLLNRVYILFFKMKMLYITRSGCTLPLPIGSWARPQHARDPIKDKVVQKMDGWLEVTYSAFNQTQTATVYLRSVFSTYYCKKNTTLTKNAQLIK